MVLWLEGEWELEEERKLIRKKKSKYRGQQRIKNTMVRRGQPAKVSYF